ncbi:cysteinyl-tRNA synthetase [Candidatus Microgenomates bacterium]|nr:cysteinyl-tRNA synthetase [Candidatus Microgenomates bacterium]
MDDLQKLLEQREKLRKEKKFEQADQIRKIIEDGGYEIIDDAFGPRLIKKNSAPTNPIRRTSPTEIRLRGVGKKTMGKVALFGSGEMSPTGRRVHEYLIKNFAPPVKIALLPTPAGFEDNPRAWYQKLQKTLEVGLQPFQPQIIYINALRNTGEKSTNEETVLKELNYVNYIHTGAGSPSYAVWHLKNSLAYQILCDRLSEGVALSFASAAAIAMGKFSLPVYEIYKVGHDPFWQEGLNFFGQWDLNFSVIPHWNNKEGGTEIDTSYCYLGKKRFSLLKKLLPERTNILCIAEQTACIFDFANQQVEIMGNGGACLIKKDQEEIFYTGQKFNFNYLK